MENNNWISVDSGKMPEPYSFVEATLVTPYDKWVEIVGFGTITFQLPGRGRTIHVSAWRPLPDPYNSELPTNTTVSTKREIEVSELQANAAIIAPGNDSWGAVQRVYEWLQSHINPQQKEKGV